jgi:hypothetical protein
MTIILEIVDRNGKNIYLTKERYKHFINHSKLQQRQNLLDDIEITIKKPTRIKYINERIIFYKFFKNQSTYLKVIVKYLNGKGFIMTMYTVENLSK